MSAIEVINEIYDQGIHLTVDNGNLVCRSVMPLSKEMRLRLRSNKADIIRLVKNRPTGTPYLTDKGEFIRVGFQQHSPVIMKHLSPALPCLC